MRPREQLTRGGNVVAEDGHLRALGECANQQLAFRDLLRNAYGRVQRPRCVPEPTVATLQSSQRRQAVRFRVKGAGEPSRFDGP